MKFSVAWAKTAVQNVQLKTAIIIVGAISIGELVIISQLSLKNPLIIERECFSKAVVTRTATPTNDEIKIYLHEVLVMRFDDSQPSKDGFLSLEELSAKEKEMSVLKQRQMNQRILISKIDVQEKGIFVNIDRVIGIGKIKSVLPLKVEVKLQETLRSPANPYGLIVTKISQIEEKEGE